MPESDDQEAILIKNCISCGSCIPAIASKCKECGDHQNFRRYISWSYAFLSLIIALGSVGALFIDRLYEYYRYKDSFVFLRFSEVKDSKIVFIADNYGERPAIIAEGHVDVYWPHGGNTEISTSTLNLSIRPGQERFIDFKFAASEVEEAISHIVQVGVDNAQIIGLKNEDISDRMECTLIAKISPYSLIREALQKAESKQTAALAKLKKAKRVNKGVDLGVYVATLRYDYGFPCDEILKHTSLKSVSYAIQQSFEQNETN